MVKNSIKVYARVKRSSDQSQAAKYNIDAKRDCQEITFRIDSPGDGGFYRNTKLKYRFGSIFTQNSTQNDVFHALAKPVVNSVLQGYNGTIFAYGQTGSGKTYSITGSSEYENRGMIPRTIQYIFNHTQKDTDVLYNIYISYLEIYSEVGYDLLNPRHRATNLGELPRVAILEDSKGRIHLRNLSVNSVASEREAMCLLFLGDTNRTIAETPMNLYSSRSHCIFTIHISATVTSDGRVRRSKLHLVDLAGSERVHKSGISGTQLVDAKQINLSLHYLEQVITALSDAKRTHVPYRNSVMTTVLRDSLGGNCLTAMLATLSIETTNFEETISTCKFAQRVAMVNTEAFINEDVDPHLEISKLKLEIDNLKKELTYYKEQTPFKNKLENKTEMTTARIKECESHVMSYLKDPSDEFPIINDLETVQAYFKIFKKMLTACQTSVREKRPPIVKDNSKKYEEIIKRKNNEISILINLLDKEKSSVRNDESSTKQNSAFNSQSDLFLVNTNEQELFETFMKDGSNKSEINACTAALQQKYKVAESLASRIKMCKQNIVNIKRRMQHPELTNELLSQLKTQQNIYRETILEMQRLKNETDHLKHGLEQAKIRMFRRFQESQTGKVKTMLPIGTHRSSNTSVDVFEYVLEDSADPFNNNIVPISIMMSSEKDSLRNTGQDHGLLSIKKSNVLTQDCDDPISMSSGIRQNKITPIQNSLTTPDCQNSNGNLPNFQRNVNYIYPNIQKPSCEQIRENLCLLNINQHQNYQKPHALAAQINQDLQSPQIENYDQKIPFDALPVYGVYIANQGDNIPVPEVTQNTANIPCCNQEMDDLRCQYNVSQLIPRNNRYPNGSIRNAAHLQPGYTACPLPERLGNIQYDTKSVNCESKNIAVSSKEDLKYISASQLPEEGIPNDDSVEEEFLKDIPLTGDPEVDEEIIAFYRARQKAFKSNDS